MRKTVIQLAAIASILLLCTGCPRGNPGNTVTVVLRGEPRLAAQVAEHLAPSLLDSIDSSSMSWTQSGQETKLKLSPVENPDSLRDRVTFGTVTRINGRTVDVQVNRVAATVAIIYVRNREIFHDLFVGDSDRILD